MRRVLFLILLLPLCLSACAGRVRFPNPPSVEPSNSLEPPADAPLVKITSHLGKHHPGKSGVYPVTSAHHALAVRLASIRAARSSIDIQYFIFRRDETGLLLTRELLHAAERGVRVRFLLDDFTTGDAGPVLLALARHPNIEMRLFNPFPHRAPRNLELLADFRRLHRRMHNKSFTVDNRVTFIGGRNLSNKYFGIDKSDSFGDLDLVAIGAAVPEIARQFDIYWNSVFSFPVSVVLAHKTPARLGRALEQQAQQLLDSDYGRSLLEFPLIDRLSRDAGLWYWVQARALYDPPHKIAARPASSASFAGGELMDIITGARRQLVVISPYVLPGEEYLQRLLAAARRGVEIHILTNSLASTDVALMHGAYRKYRKPLLAAGVHLYELASDLKYKLDNWNGESRSLLHAKLFAIDGKHLYVGSFNLDPRSVLLNTELGLLVDSPQLTAAVADNFIRNVRRNAHTLELHGNRLRWRAPSGQLYRRDPGASWLQRLGSRLSSWLPLESLL